MNKWALVTGGSMRIGCAITQRLHKDGFNIALHYSQSSQPARQLCDSLNANRANSCTIFQADFNQQTQIEVLITQVKQHCPTLSVLVNNASLFIADPDAVQYKDILALLSVNLIAPYLLSKGLQPVLDAQHGSIINLLDIHGDKPLKRHGLYSITKSALKMATLSLAQELGPKIRVNAVSPGAILWPSKGNNPAKNEILAQIPLQKLGTPEDIADAVKFLIDAPYISGQIIAVDGGRTATGYLGAE